MKFHLIILLYASAWAQTAPAPLRLTISPQKSPYALPDDLKLYSAELCSDLTVSRAVPAGRIRQAFEDAGGQFVDPALLPLMINRYVAHSVKGILLSGTGYTMAIVSIGGAGIAAYKSAQPKIGNAATWDKVSVATGTIGVVIPLARNALQSDVAAQRASITNGVQAALITDMQTIYTVPAEGCMKSVMFIGGGLSTVIKAVLP